MPTDLLYIIPRFAASLRQISATIAITAVSFLIISLTTSRSRRTSNQQTSEALRDGALERCVHEAQRMTDSETIRLSCSSSPRPIVWFLLLWIQMALEVLVVNLFISAPLFSEALVKSLAKQASALRDNTYQPKQQEMVVLIIGFCIHMRRKNNTYLFVDPCILKISIYICENSLYLHEPNCLLSVTEC